VSLPTPNTPTGSSAAASGAAAPDAGKPRRSVWSWLFAGQELGLVAVIAVMMIGLTLASENKNIPDVKPLDPSAKVEVMASEVVVTDADGTVTRYAKADGYGFVERFGAKLIDRKERVILAAGDKTEELPDNLGIRLVPATGPPRDFLYSAGWSLVEPEGEGPKRIERDPVVNTFLNRDNLINVGTYAAFIAIMAVGMTGIIVMGGIDLSVGSIYGLAAVGGAFVLAAIEKSSPGLPWFVTLPLGVVLCSLIGGVCGLINGVGTVGLKVHPFIITLGGMAVYRGLAFLVSQGQTIGGLPESYLAAVKVTVAGVNPVPTVVMLIVGAIGAFVATRTVIGRQTFAIGGNETAAKYAGIRVGAVKIWLFVVMGVLSGLSASLMLGHLGGGSSAAGQGYELDVIAATVVGGVSLAGGRGSVVGAVLGAIVIQLINNGFNVLGIDNNYRQIVIGLAIVGAVVIDQAKHRLVAKR
jgi:ribose/xylose/arabinose/galactoside ABC-type transport system permease subunit